MKELQIYKHEIKIDKYSFKEQVNDKYKHREVKLSKRQRKNKLTLFQAADKRISGKSSSTATDRVMIDDLTPSVDTAGAGTRVGTLLFDTCSVLRAVGTDHTLWSARRR